MSDIRCQKCYKDLTESQRSISNICDDCNASNEVLQAF